MWLLKEMKYTKIHCKRYDHISPTLRDLHWLPVEKRIQHKLLSITYACLNHLAPEYLIETIPRYIPLRQLRSASQLRIELPAVDETNKSRSGGKSFRNAAPKLWNSLPEGLKLSKNIQRFRKGLKTHLFMQN